jgi:predicted secreted protein
MSVRNGSIMVVKIGSGTNPEIYTILNGVKSAQLVLNNQYLNASDVNSGAWRTGQNSGGIQSATINLSGVFTDSQSERSLRQNAVSNRTSNYRFYFSKGDYLAGLFHVSSFSLQSGLNSMEEYALTLQSAGELTYNHS